MFEDRKKQSRGGKRLWSIASAGMILSLGLAVCMPVLVLFAGSFADEIEWTERLRPLFLDNSEYISWKWVPDYPTLAHYRDLLFYNLPFLTMFWNSIKIVACILFGQLLIGMPGAWAFAVYDFKCKNLLFSVYVILMLLPFQVTMLSKYLILNRLNLLDTDVAVILPAVFSTFPVFLMYRGFRNIPRELCEVARMDGASEWTCFCSVGIPLTQGSIMAAFVLSFLESWSMMEEPLAFLREKALWPLSLYLPEISMEQAGQACAASVITLALSLFLFAVFRDSLEKGIISSALKE